MKLNSKHTVGAACVGYLTQAITINFAPLLFITFQNTYDISMGKISLLIGISFLTQLLSDMFVAKFNAHINTRGAIIFAHLCAVGGMCGFAFLPEIMPTPYMGLALSIIIAAIGGGIIEVLISPVVEACPTEEKSSVMSFLHSFYCWGVAGVVLLSTLFFRTVGIEHWRLLACLWGIIPAFGAVSFIFVPIYTLRADEEISLGNRKSNDFLGHGIFWVFFAMMFCSGAAEQSMSQWASSFAESGLGVQKALGDILGPCAFALFMGAARLFYSRQGSRIKLTAFITASAALSVATYILTAISHIPMLSLASCALCGLSVGIMWPGTYSLASESISGSVRMFAMLAIAGDLGCLVGPTAAGWIAEGFGNDLKISFFISAIFPLTILILMKYVLRYRRENHNKS